MKQVMDVLECSIADLTVNHALKKKHDERGMVAPMSNHGIRGKAFHQLVAT